MTRSRKRKTNFDYDICLSFAGEDRKYVEAVAKELKDRGIRTFYDMYEEDHLWGKDLFEHLDYVYGQAARYCVMFISKHYARKVWTSHERKAAQERALKDHQEYILPARFDSTPLPGVRSTIGYVSVSNKTPEDFANLIIRKLTPERVLEFQHKRSFLPPRLDKVYTYFPDANSDIERLVDYYAHSFLKSLSRLDQDELLVVGSLLTHSCPHDFPNNFHMELDLLRRITKFPISKIRQLGIGMSSVGFWGKIASTKKHASELLYLNWGIDGPESQAMRQSLGISPNQVVTVIMQVMGKHYCEFHALESFRKLNFSALSVATSVPDKH